MADAVARLARAAADALPLLASLALVRAAGARCARAVGGGGRRGRAPAPVARPRTRVARALERLLAALLGALALAASNDLRGTSCAARGAAMPAYAALLSAAALVLLLTTTRARVSAWSLLTLDALADGSGVVWLLLARGVARRAGRHELATSLALGVGAADHFARCRARSSGLALLALVLSAGAASARLALATARAGARAALTRGGGARPTARAPVRAARWR